jgi:hypothetical protein
MVKGIVVALDEPPERACRLLNNRVLLSSLVAEACELRPEASHHGVLLILTSDHDGGDEAMPCTEIMRS